jgi:coenzyme F420-reducing hydrogenase alpha subunit
MSKRRINVSYLARVEGEGALSVRIRDGVVEEAHLSIFEPPRFYEAFLRGRRFDEAPDITSRICGICPIAYQMSALQAMEGACGVRVEGKLRDLRRLIYCGEWIESHALHVIMLHAPDFLGFQDALEMAREHPEIVKKGLALKKAGNEIVRILGGREIHPVNLRVGGFYSVPRKEELLPLARQLEEARETALALVRWVAGFPFPDFERDWEFVSLYHPSEYPITEGTIVSSGGLDIPISGYESHFQEEHVRHTTALQSRPRKGDLYVTGPLARFNLNFECLSDVAKEAAREAGIVPPCRNPFKMIVVRAIEILYACDEALRIIAEYEEPASPAVDVAPRAATGWGCTEAPRGSLYHRYRLDDAGIIQTARIVPPTSQNQRAIESDLAGFVSSHLDLPDEKLTWGCEQVIRNYDPCISCATHFLRLELDRR